MRIITISMMNMVKKSGLWKKREGNYQIHIQKVFKPIFGIINTVNAVRNHDNQNLSPFQRKLSIGLLQNIYRYWEKVNGEFSTRLASLIIFNLFRSIETTKNTKSHGQINQYTKFISFLK